MRTWRPPRAALALVALGLVLRVALIAATPNYAPVIPYDALDYHRHADSIAAGDGYPSALLLSDPDAATAFRPPLYPSLLAAAYALTPSTLTVGRLLGALLGALSVLLVFLVADRVWGRRVALASAGLTAAFPPLVALSGALTVESLFIPLELGLVLAVLAYARSPAPRYAVLAGVVCGLAALTRQNGFLLVIPLLLGLLAAHGRAGLRQAAVASAGALAAAALVVAPWTVRNAIVFDGNLVPVSTSVGYALLGTYNERSRHNEQAKGAWLPPGDFREGADVYERRDYDEADIDRELAKRAFEHIADHPGYAVEATALNAYRLFNPEALPALTELSYDAMAVPTELRDVLTVSYFALALLAVAGGALAIRRGQLGPLWLWSLPIVLAFSFATLNGEPRYRTLLDPFIAMLAGVALALLAGLIARAKIEWPTGNETRPSAKRSDEKIR